MTCSPQALHALAAGLHAAGYTADAVTARLGIRVPDDVGLLNHAVVLERLRADASITGTLTRLFFLETDEPSARVWDAGTRRALQRGGLLRVRGRRVTARLRLDAAGGQWLLADRRFRSPDQRALSLPPGDPVYPPGSDSVLLRDTVVHTDGGHGNGGMVLDLCTGSGVQALALAARARSVIAIDISPRAAALAGANAMLNAIGNVEVRRGDLYRPVAGERFDTIVANPPFVASPYRRGPAYHSGGPTGARVLRRIVAGLAPALQPHGRFFAVSHLALRNRETVADVVRPWFQGFPGRAVALVLESGSAVDLAAAQALFALVDGVAAYAAEVRRWVDYLRRHRVREIVVLLLAAEHGARRGFETIEAFQRTLPLPLSHPPRHHLEQWFAAG